MEITPTATLAEIVTAKPVLSRVLDGIGLDYCCHGQRSLADACDAAGLDAAAVVAQLNEAGAGAGPAPDWTSLSPGELSYHVEHTHHRFLHAEMPRIAALAAKVAEVHGSRHPELAEVARVYLELKADLEPHLATEEQTIFPAIRALDSANPTEVSSLEAPISVLMTEHDRAGELLEELRRLTGGYQTPADGCASYQALYMGLAEIEADTHIHVHKENNVLFPAVRELEARLQPTSS